MALATAIRQTIDFVPSGEWAEVSAPVDWPDGGRAVNVIARSPQPDRTLTPPGEITVGITAMVGTLQIADLSRYLLNPWALRATEAEAVLRALVVLKQARPEGAEQVIYS